MVSHDKKGPNGRPFALVAQTVASVMVLFLAACGGGGDGGGSETATVVPETPAFLECEDCFQISRGIYGTTPTDAFILTKRNRFQVAGCSTRIEWGTYGKFIGKTLSQLWSHSAGLSRMIDLDAAVEKKETLASNDEFIASRGAGPAQWWRYNALVDGLSVKWMTNGCGPKSYAKADYYASSHDYFEGFGVRVQRSDSVGVDIRLLVHDFPDKGGVFEVAYTLRVSNIEVDDGRYIELAVGEETSLPEYHVRIKRESDLLYTFVII